MYRSPCNCKITLEALPLVLDRGSIRTAHRGIRIWLSPAHSLVSRALHRADNLTIRFRVGLALVEFCSFWVGTRDGGDSAFPGQGLPD
jgi:hypothetical protein